MMNREQKLNITSGVISGLLFALAYALHILQLCVGYSKNGVTLKIYMQIAGWLWVNRLPRLLPIIIAILAACILLDAVVRTVNPAFRFSSIMYPGNAVKYTVSVVILAVIGYLTATRLLAKTIGFSVFNIVDQIADNFGIIFVAPNGILPFLLSGVILAVLIAALFSKHGLLGDLDEYSWNNWDVRGLPLILFRGAVAGFFAGAAVYASFYAVATTHVILKSVTLWLFPPKMYLVAVFFLPLPAAALMIFSSIMADDVKFRTRAGMAAIAALCVAAAYSAAAVETNHATKYDKFLGVYPGNMFNMNAGNPYVAAPHINETMIVFKPNNITVMNKTDKNNDMDDYGGDAYTKINIRKAETYLKNYPGDFHVYDKAMGFLMGKAGYDMDIPKELEMISKYYDTTGRGGWYLFQRLQHAAVTPRAMSLIDYIAEKQQVRLNNELLQKIGAVYRHQGRESKAKKWYERVEEADPQFKDASGYNRPVFVKGAAEGRLFIGDRPAAGALAALITTDLEFQMIRIQKNLIFGRDNLAAAAVTDGNGYFHFDGLGDDMTYFLIAIFPADEIEPRPEPGAWSNVFPKVENAPGIVTISRDKPFQDLGVIRLPDYMRHK